MQMRGVEEREKEREGREEKERETYLYASQNLGDVGVMVCKYMEEQLRSSVEPHRTGHSPSMAW